MSLVISSGSFPEQVVNSCSFQICRVCKRAFYFLYLVQKKGEEKPPIPVSIAARMPDLP